MANAVTYGFHDLQSIFAERVADTNVEILSNAWAVSLAEHQRQIDAFLGLFVQRTTEYKVRFQSAVNARLQPLDQNGKPLPVKPAGRYEVALPIQAAGISWGANDVTRAKMTVGDVNRQISQLLLADARWVRDHVLAALFYNGAGWTFSDELHGDLTVMGLANGDATTYQILAGSDAAATDDHYLGQAAGIADGTNPYPTIKTELRQHPENSGDVVALIASNLRADTENLTLFREGPDPNLSQPSTASVLTATLGVNVPGELIGYVDGVFVAEWASLPSGYIIATTTGGDKALAMREHKEPQLQGFQPKTEFQHHPYWERDYVRWAGFGAWNRVGAVAMEIADASYDIPTGYTSPSP